MLQAHWVPKTTHCIISHVVRPTVLVSQTNPSQTLTLYSVRRGSDGRRYMDPEYFRTGHVSVASDVYSFGVMMCAPA